MLLQLIATATWTQLAIAGPGPRAFAPSCYDTRLREVVVLGGFGTIDGWTEWRADSWRFTGERWLEDIEQPPAHPPKFAAALTYMPAIQAGLMFGGTNCWPCMGGRETREAWLFDRSSGIPDINLWIPAISPPCEGERSGARMVYDASRRVVVLFGGHRVWPNDASLADTWELDEWGERWKRALTFAAPPAREDHAMVYDAARERVLLYGGKAVHAGADTRLGDTWTYTRRGWARLAGDQPGPRHGACLAYDYRRRDVVLYGGLGPGSWPPSLLGDTWVRITNAWELRSTDGPSPRMFPACEGTADGVLLYGGSRGFDALYSDTWVYR